MSFKNIKIYILMRKEKNKNEDNLAININFNPMTNITLKIQQKKSESLHTCVFIIKSSKWSELTKDEDANLFKLTNLTILEAVLLEIGIWAQATAPVAHASL
jgi:hypothetical protein